MVVEGRDQTGGVLDFLAGVAGAGEARFLLDPAEGVGDGLFVDALDFSAGAVVGERPHHRHAFRWGEHQVVAGHWLADAGLLRADPRAELALIFRRSAVAVGEQPGADLVHDLLRLRFRRRVPMLAAELPYRYLVLAEQFDVVGEFGKLTAESGRFERGLLVRALGN